MEPWDSILLCAAHRPGKSWVSAYLHTKWGAPGTAALPVLWKAFRNHRMKDVAEMKACSMGFLGLFCWFLIEQAIPTSDSLFGWPAWRGFVSGKLENKKKKTFCREKHAFLKAFDSTGGATFCWPCAWWSSTAESTNKRKSCSCATCFLPKHDLIVISFLLWSVKSEPFGNPGAVVGFALMVFL